MEKLEISRGTLREQLAMLEYLGVLRRRRGHGTYLDAPDASLFRTSFTLMHRLGYLGTAQFVQAREMIEESIAAEAALQVTDTDIAELRPIVDRMVERTADGDHEGALEADLQIHDYLFDTVDNPVFNMINVGLSTVLRENIRSRRTLALELECVGDVDAINTDTVHFGIVDAGEHPSSRGREGDRRPVTGGVARACTGELVIFAAGADAASITSPRFSNTWERCARSATVSRSGSTSLTRIRASAQDPRTGANTRVAPPCGDVRLPHGRGLLLPARGARL